MKKTASNNKQFESIIRSATKKLVSYEFELNKGLIHTPLIYSGGSGVLVYVKPTGKNYTVSDGQEGFGKIQLLGGDKAYQRVAKDVSQATGIKFDGFAIFTSSVSKEQLPGAIASVANASQEAVNLTAIELYKDLPNVEHMTSNPLQRVVDIGIRERGDAERLHDRLKELFPPEAVSKNAVFSGASNQKWKFTSVINLGRKKAVFQLVFNHSVSISSAMMKFSDLSRLKEAPKRVAVVKGRDGFGNRLDVLAPFAEVIEREASSNAYKKILNGTVKRVEGGVGVGASAVIAAGRNS